MPLNFIRKHYGKIVFLIVPLTMFSALFFYEVDSYIKYQEQEFHDTTLRMKITINDEMQKYLFGLQGAKGLISGIGLNYTPEQFRRYAQSRDFFSNFPGSLGYGFIRSVPKSKIASFLSERRKSNPHFNIHPTVDTDPLMIIETIEPIEKNRPAAGLNIAFEAKRSSAAIRSADLGLALLTEKVSLVQLGKKHAGFLYFLPVYNTVSTPFTIKERQQTLVGWAYTPIVLENVVSALEAKFPANIHLALKVGEDETSTKIGTGFEKSWVFSNWTEESTIIGGLNWQMQFSKSPLDVHMGLLAYLVAYLIGAGLIFSIYQHAHRAYKAKDTSFINQKKWTKGIIESSDHAIISTDSLGTILIFNPAAEKMLGYTADDLVNKHNPSLIHLPDEVLKRSEELSIELGFKIPPSFETFTAKASRGTTDTNDWTYVRKNGSKLRVRLTVTAIRDESEEIIGYLGIAVDLTEELKSSQIIELQRAKMIEASKMSSLGEMAGGVAHEINTPLAVIISKSSTVKKQLALGNVSNEILIGHIQRIEQTAQHISRIVKGLRLFSRNSDSDKLTEVSLNSVVELTLDLCHEKIKINGIELTKNIPQDLRVLGREAELSQVIMNLISNSIDAINSLPQKWINIDCTVINNRVRLTLTDSGHGISPVIVDKMMQPFFTTKEVGKGTGLGLSISKGIIENFQGSLYYNSASRNTQFVIELREYDSSTNQRTAS